MNRAVREAVKAEVLRLGKIQMGSVERALVHEHNARAERVLAARAARQIEELEAALAE